MEISIVLLLIMSASTIVGMERNARKDSAIQNNSKVSVVTIKEPLEVLEKKFKPEAPTLFNIYSFTNGATATLSTFEAISFVYKNAIFDPITTTMGVSLFGAEAIQQFTSAAAVNTDSILFPAVLTATNGVNCFLRLFLSQVQSDPTLFALDVTHATVSGMNTAYFAYRSVKNFAQWFKNHSETALTRRIHSPNKQNKESDDE